MKRLFMLREANGKPFQGIPRANGPLSFATKKEAKERRDEINKLGLNGDVTVSAGPDHRNYRGA